VQHPFLSIVIIRRIRTIGDEQGSVPGTLSIEDDATPPQIILIDYNQSQATRTQLAMPEACIPYLNTGNVSWVDVRGLGSEKILKRLGGVFNLHPLVLEDVVNVPQRPKLSVRRCLFICETVTIVPFR